MNSQLTPREIQTRIRSGESLDEVAKAAGVPVEKVEPFAAPVIAEREHVASTALTSPVRRNGDAGNHRTLRQVVSERLLSRGLDIDDVEWDAWRVAERKWTVRGTYQSGSATREAEFRYDQLGRFSIADNDDARWLLNEQTASHGPQPNRRRRDIDPDHEPTVDFTDEFALAYAVGVASETPIVDEVPSEGFELSDDAELTQVDGVYDIVPKVSQLDVLYDMFHSMNEDSVEIYPGLAEVRPVGGIVDEDASEVPHGDDPTLEGEVLLTSPETQRQADEYEPEPAIEPEASPVTQIVREKPSRRQRRKQTTKREPEALPAANGGLEQLPLVDVAADVPTQLPPTDVVAETPVEEQTVQESTPDLPPTVAQDDSDAGEVVLEMESEPQTPPEPAAEPEPEVAPAETVEPEPMPKSRAVTTPAPTVPAPAPAPSIPQGPAADEEIGDPVPADEPAEPVQEVPVPEVSAPEVGAPQDAEPEPEAHKPSVDPEETVVVPRTRARKGNKKRASVPSWDEIMFGAPRPPQG